MKHPVALDHRVRTLEEVLRVNRPEEALVGTQDHRNDIHAHLVDQTCGKHLAAHVPGGDFDDPVTGQLLAFDTAASTPSTK